MLAALGKQMGRQGSRLCWPHCCVLLLPVGCIVVLTSRATLVPPIVHGCAGQVSLLPLFINRLVLLVCNLQPKWVAGGC
jgi:hypothetical protein